MATELTLTLDGLKEKIDAINAIDVKIAEAAGNAAKRRADAEKYVSDNAPKLDVDTARGYPKVAKVTDSFIQTLDSVSPVHSLVFVDSAIDALNEYKRDIQAAVELQVINHLKATSKGSDETATLLETRNNLCISAVAMRNLFAQMHAIKDDEYSVPATKNATTGGGGTNNVSAKGSRHYFKGISGRKVPAADAEGRIFYANTAYSYLAFWADVSSQELTAALKQAGVTSFTKPWEANVTVTRSKGEKKGEKVTFTCGMVVDEKTEKKADE